MPNHQDERDEPPAEVRAGAEQRAAARADRDFATADRLKEQIEQAGWKVIDAGVEFRLEPADAPNVEVGGVLRYGSSAGVPSRLGEPDAAHLTMVTVDRPPEPDSDPGAQWIAVVSEPSASLPLGYEQLPTVGPLGLAAAWNIGLRRAVGSQIVLLAPGQAVRPEQLAQVSESLADESVAAVGAAGLTSADLRRWRPSPAGEVDALDAGLIAFRRRDAVRRGPLDERFATPRLLAIWWSLVLRDEGQDRPPRKAIALEPPAGVARFAESAGQVDEVDDRQARRDFYRLIDRFGRRFELLREPVRPTTAAAKGRRQPR